MLKASNLEAVRGGRSVFRALGFGVSAGRSLLLRGPNGSGKSTLLRAIAGLLRPHDGQITWDGSDIYDRDQTLRHNLRLHYVGHQDPVKAVFTVLENLAAWISSQDGAITAGSEDQNRAALDRLGIDRLHDLPARFLSAGQKRRLNLARLVAVHRPLWLLDEPTVSLDADGVKVFGSLVAEHLANGGLVIAASHIDLGLEGTGASVSDTLSLDDFSRPPFTSDRSL